MKIKGWKILAILMTIIAVGALVLQFTIVEPIVSKYKKDTVCGRICDEEYDATLYQYDLYNSICYCADAEGKTIYHRIIS